MSKIARSTAVAVVLAAGSAMAQETVRFATWNVSMSGEAGGAGSLEGRLANPATYARGRATAEVIQRLRPDVLLLNEFDYNPNNPMGAIDLFRQNFLAMPQEAGLQAISYPHVYIAPVNTGVQPGGTPGVDGALVDFNNNGQTSAQGDPNDAYGFGNYPGQFGMVLLSKYPIQGARTFQTFLWKDMPGNRLPDNPATPEPQDWYTSYEKDIFRLSSKSHWDVTVDVDGTPVHVLASHPTPPIFDSVQLPGFPTDPFVGNLVDYNGKRNADEIRIWDDYITPGAAGYLYDDAGTTGGLGADDAFVIMGDLNADPDEGDGIRAVIQDLLANPQLTDPQPIAPGRADPTDTATFNLRADYVLPSDELLVTGSGVFWPPAGAPGGDVVVFSDHRLVYVDVIVPEPTAVGALSLALTALRRIRR